MAHLGGQGQGFTADLIEVAVGFRWTWFWDWFTSKGGNLNGIQKLIKVKLRSVEIRALICLSTTEDLKLMRTLMKTCFFFIVVSKKI